MVAFVRMWGGAGTRQCHTGEQEEERGAERYGYTYLFVVMLITSSLARKASPVHASRALALGHVPIYGHPVSLHSPKQPAATRSSPPAKKRTEEAVIHPSTLMANLYMWPTV